MDLKESGGIPVSGRRKAEGGRRNADEIGIRKADGSGNYPLIVDWRTQ